MDDLKIKFYDIKGNLLIKMNIDPYWKNNPFIPLMSVIKEKKILNRLSKGFKYY